MKHTLIFISLIFSSCYLSDELPPDQTVWEYDLPSNVNLNQEGLLSLNTRIATKDFEQLKGLIIIKEDKLVFENYYLANSRYTLNELNGASMAITVAAVGIAIENGLFALDDKIQDYLPEYDDIFKDNNNKTFISIHHLLLNKSGLSWDNTDFFNMQQSTDWVRYVLEKPMPSFAGNQFDFNNGAGLLLAKIIEVQSGISFKDFVNANIFQPLNVSNFEIYQDAQGNYDGGFGIAISLIDFTKIGYLILEEGIWEGRRVLDPNYVEEVTSIQTTVTGDYNAGYFWRRFGEGFEDSFGIGHEDIIFITGEIGQHLYIIPSKKMVIAIDAENYFFNFYNPSLNLLGGISYMIQ